MYTGHLIIFTEQIICISFTFPKGKQRQGFGYKLLIWDLVPVGPTPLRKWEFEIGQEKRPVEGVLVIR